MRVDPHDHGPRPSATILNEPPPPIGTGRDRAATTARNQRSRGTILGLRGLFWAIDLYTLLSFVLTSSWLQALYAETGVFIDDLHAGVYDFHTEAVVDQRMLELLHAARSSWNRDTLYVGYQDRHHNPFGTASHCFRLGVDLGANNIVRYYHDGRSRRVIKKFHGRLPPTCTGFTVPMGDAYNSTRRVTHVNDARLTMGQSFLHCTYPALWGPLHYDSDPRRTPNVTEFFFKAAYVIVQQHFSNAHYGIECQLSYCVARKVADDVDYWAVYPAQADDTRAYVNIMFTAKGTIMSILDVLGQGIITLILARELIHVWRRRDKSPVRIPIRRRAYWWRWCEYLQGRSEDEATERTLLAGPSRLKLSRAWLSDPYYMVACMAFAISATVESQMILEVYYWQYTQSKNFVELLYAGMYAMRHAWVGIGIHAALCSLFAKMACGTSGRVRGVFAHLVDVNRYVSTKTFIVSFFAAAIVTTRMRGVLYLWDHEEVPDVGLGVKKASPGNSEVAHSLYFHHGVAQIISYIIAVVIRFLCHRVWPGHRSNSVVRAMMEQSWWASFDVIYFLTTNSCFTGGDGEFLIACRFSELHRQFCNFDLLHSPEVAFSSWDESASWSAIFSSSDTSIFEIAADTSHRRLHVHRTPELLPVRLRRASAWLTDSASFLSLLGRARRLTKVGSAKRIVSSIRQSPVMTMPMKSIPEVDIDRLILR